jgi:hypothetical protein
VKICFELAGARLGIGAPAQIQQRMDDRFKLLSAGAPDAASSTMRTTDVAVAVHRYFSILRGPSFGSRTSSRCVSAPTAIGIRMPATSPVACATGTTA